MKAEPENEHISAYERAVCYYTLPKVISPITYGLVAVYALCILESLAALVYGYAIDNQTWKVAGAATFAAMTVFGMLAFTIRAVINDWRRRSVLAYARHVPDPNASDDIPNPFADHILLRRLKEPRTEVYACMTNTGGIEYYIEIKKEHHHWHINTPQDQRLFEVLLEHDSLPVGLFKTSPLRVSIFSEKKRIATVVCRNTLRSTVVDIFEILPAETTYCIKDGCIYCANRLVGRIYDIRSYLYLDIERQHATSGILAYFMTQE